MAQINENININSVHSSSKLFLVIQFLAILSIVYAFSFFATMGSANMGWLPFLLFWGTPSLFQIALSLKDLSHRSLGAFSWFKKYSILLVIWYVFLYLNLIFPFIANIYQYQEGYPDRLNGIGDHLTYLFLIFPNIIYFLMSVMELVLFQNLPDKSFINKTKLIS